MSLHMNAVKMNSAMITINLQFFFAAAFFVFGLGHFQQNL